MITSENGAESSHLNFEESRCVQNQQSMKSKRRKIYDDGDFKEVVKNFYSMIASLNKQKGQKICKTQKSQWKPQIKDNKKQDNKLDQNIYKKTQILIDSQQTQPLQQKSRLRLNSTHISIAYWTYIAKNNLYNLQPPAHDKEKSLQKLLCELDRNEEEKE